LLLHFLLKSWWKRLQDLSFLLLLTSKMYMRHAYIWNIYYLLVILTIKIWYNKLRNLIKWLTS
jgi:hypothetical protein